MINIIDFVIEMNNIAKPYVFIIIIYIFMQLTFLY